MLRFIVKAVFIFFSKDHACLRQCHVKGNYKVTTLRHGVEGVFDGVFDAL